MFRGDPLAMIGPDSMAETSLAVRRACDELSRQLRAGHACGAEEFLAAEPAIGSDTDAVLELLYTEFIVRQQLGEQPLAQEWLERFPQWRIELAQLFEIHALVDGDHTLAGGLSDTQREVGSTTPGTSHFGADRDQGRFLDGYEILQEIGRGGMGVVYQARQRGLGRIVALKMILPPHGPRERARFRSEAEATARLSHPNIVPIYEVGQDGDCPFLSMEFVAGTSLDKQLASSLLAPPAAAELLMALARAVAYAHEQGIIHRDLKPANVLLSLVTCHSSFVKAESQMTSDKGQMTIPKITDFGLAKTVNEGQAEMPSVAIVGTPSYMAPEQCQSGSKVGPAADVYALGAILYEALTGRPPFRGQTALDILELVRSQEPVPPSRLVPKVPRDLETICLKCLAKQPQQRYASATALADDLRRFLGSEPILARPVGRTERTLRWCQRNPVVAALAGGIALVLLCGTVVSTSLAVWAVREKSRANQHAEQEHTARELAEYRFAQAEKAVEEYLDGIENNEHLKEADFLDLRKRLLMSAVPFYEEFVKQKPGDTALEAKRGRAYGRLGLLRRQMGEREQAAADFEWMQAILEPLGITDPNHRSELAKSHYGLAAVLSDQGQLREAQIEYHQSIDLYRKLAAEFPANAAYRQPLAISQRNLGLVLRDLGRRDEAEVELRGALAIVSGLATAFPTVAAYREDMARIHFFLAPILTKGAEEEAETLLRQAVVLFRQLVDEFPKRPEHRLGLATAHTNLGAFLSERNKREETLANAQMAITLRKQLAAEFPAIPAYRQHLALGHRNLAGALEASGKREDAEIELRQSLALLEHLTADFRGIPAYRFDLAESHHDLGSLLDNLSKPEEADNEHRQALAIRTQLATEFPAAPQYRRFAARSHYDLGLRLTRAGRHSEAESELVQSINLRKRLVAEFPDDVELLRPFALAQSYLGLVLDRLKRRPEAKAVYREALKSWLPLLEELPADTGCLTGTAQTFSSLAGLLKRDGEIEEARQLYALAAEHQLKAHQAVPTNSTYALYLRQDYHGLGDVALLLKDHATAAEAGGKLALVRPDVADDAQLAARILGRCVQLAELDMRLSEGERVALKQAYADQAMEHLREAVRRGYDKVALLKSLAALDPLRARPDFQQLVQELEGR